MEVFCHKTLQTLTHLFLSGFFDLPQIQRAISVTLYTGNGIFK